MSQSRTGATSSSASHEQRVADLRRKDERPNILLIMTDQQRADTVAASGADFMKTPNMDRLAAGGRLYRNAYSPNPICMSARHNMLTGLTARYHGYPDNCWGFGMPPGLPTFPEILSDGGYETRTIGKNHFYPPRRHNGYLNMDLMQEVPAFREQDEYLLYLKEQGLGNILNIHGVRNLLYMVPQQSQISDANHGTTWVADRAVDFISTNCGRHPWLLKLGFIAPHPPFDVPAEYADLYKEADLPEPSESETPLAPLAEENKLLGDIPNKTYLRRMRELYYGAITHIDKNLGRIIASLEESGQLENTLIIFTSDHGEMLGDHGTFQKWLPYDASAKIPMIIHYPGSIPPGEVSDELVDLNDLFPTILDAAGIDYPGEHGLPGESLLINEGGKDRSRQYVEYSDGNRRWISLRDEQYKYNYYYGGGMEELFDLTNDPGECRNLLASTPTVQHENIRRRLKIDLVGHEERWGMPGGVVDGDLQVRAPYIPKPYRNKAFPIFQEKLTDPKEQMVMNSHIDEVLAVTADEKTVRFADLDLEVWKTNGGYTDEDIAHLLEREAKTKETI